MNLYGYLKGTKQRGFGRFAQTAYNATRPPNLFKGRSRLAALVKDAAEHTRRPKVLMIGSNLPPSQLPPFDACYVQIDIQRQHHISCRCDAEALPFADGAFDVVVATSVLEHTHNPQKIVTEMGRVCKAGTGTVYISVPWQYPLHGEPYDFWRFSMHGLEWLCRDLEIEEKGSESGGWATFRTMGEHALARGISGGSPTLFLIGSWVGQWLVYPLNLLELLFYRRKKRMFALDSILYVVCRVPVEPSPSRERAVAVSASGA